jgi:hypothetical protein
MTDTDGGNYFQEPGVDELYKREWITMMVYSLLTVECMKGTIPEYRDEDILSCSRNVANVYCELQGAIQ